MQVEGVRDDNIANFNNRLDSDFEALQHDVTDVRNAAQHEMILDEAAGHDNVVAFLTGLQQQVFKLQLEQQRIASFQKRFHVAPACSQELIDTSDEIALKLGMWVGHATFSNACIAWRETPFKCLDLEQMEETVLAAHKACFKAERSLPPNKKAPQFRSLVDEQRALLPVLHALANPALKDRHWAKIEAAIGQPLSRGEGNNGFFTVAVLQNLDAVAQKDAISVASTEATQEAALEGLLASVTARWGEVEFTCVPYKDSKDMVILTAIDEVTLVLEDSMVTMSAILSSRCAFHSCIFQGVSSENQ
jgi:dynein heavy chain, axonemal